MRSEFRSGSKSVPFKTVQYVRIYINGEDFIMPVTFKVGDTKNDLNMRFKKISNFSRN